ncbi:lysM domain receptor-like kinase 3 [Vicia villosa]|uniref:lysM domain receptor-like kinase 3 n=1 Tax=Vicia villosa TaxID=3911 RepID=UPI00273C32CC|nr:lysM domain receptor-like kinase 3 [Vicia villosa]
MNLLITCQLLLQPTITMFPPHSLIKHTFITSKRYAYQFTFTNQTLSSLLIDQMKLKSCLLLFLFVECVFYKVESKCVKGCDIALASYYVMPAFKLQNITNFMQSKIVSEFNSSDVLIRYNRHVVSNRANIFSYFRVNVPFPCDCIGGEFLGHVFEYTSNERDTYDLIANYYYASLTSVELLQKFNSYDPNHIPIKAKVNVTVNCSCGNSQISKDYGLFITYPLRSTDTLEKIANETELDEGLIQNFNPDVNFSKGSGIVFIPGIDQNGDYVPLYPRTAGLAKGATVGISIAGIFGLLLLVICIYVKYFQKKGEKKAIQKETSLALSTRKGNVVSISSDVSGYETSGSIGHATSLTGVMMEKSTEFSYEELAKATNNFSLDSKIGQGAFGTVYYAELRGKKTAIKKMKIQATREFLAELKVLTSVYHWNLVQLIGYCVEGFLFLVYEYMDNGNLSQHLHDSEREPIPWTTRIQIALDVARGLEYIHDHSVPVYIHRDIKSDNILLNENFTGKIADFGLTKLTDVASSTDNTIHVAGTFGYMPPENAYGRISRKIDVYAFGVVLYQLISAKAAVIKIDKHSTEFTSLEIKTNESIDEYKSLVALFDEVIDQEGDSIESLRNLVDPRLGDNYSIDSINKMAQLAKDCTNRDPKGRPRMRAVVVSLMKLNSTIDDGNMTGSEALSLTMEHDELH